MNRRKLTKYLEAGIPLIKSGKIELRFVLDDIEDAEDFLDSLLSLTKNSPMTFEEFYKTL